MATEISELRTAQTWEDPAVGYLASVDVYRRLHAMGLLGSFPHPVKVAHRLPTGTFICVVQKEWDAR